MSITTTVTGALNELLSRLSARQSWINREQLIRRGKHFATLLSVVARGEPRKLQDDAADDVSTDVRGTLNVISGRHRGARIYVSERSYVIGSGDDCDVVLRDEGVAERHCVVTLGRHGFSVQDVRGEDPQALSAKRVFSSEEAIQSEYEIGGVLFRLSQHRPGPERSVFTDSERNSRAGRWPIPALAMLGAILIISALPGVQRAVQPASAEQLASLVVSGSEALAGRGFDSVRFRAAAGGGLEVTGFVADLAEEMRLRQWLNKENYSGVRVAVRPIPQLLDDVRQTLRDDALHVDLDGRNLRIQGTTHQPPVKDRIRSLGEQLRGLVEIDDRVVYTPASVAPGPLPVRLRGVMLDEPRYFVTDSGARYFVGGVLPDGAEVVSIATDGIRFKKNGQIRFYSLE